ncbi:MAG TPA: DUF6382 domain-containing protein [Bacillota bacterium]|nr:DUF6382 domain-containing protein [Bacillota bacterium]
MKGELLGFRTTRPGKGPQGALCLSGDEEHLSNLLQFQLGMLTNNRIPGLLPLRVKQRDLQVSLIYPVGGLTSLTDLLASTPLKAAELGELLENLLQPVVDCRNYFLNEAGFVMEPDYVFLNPVSLRTYLVYVPIAPWHGWEQGYTHLVEAILRKLGVAVPGYFACLAGSSHLERLRSFARQLGRADFDRCVVAARGQLPGTKPPHPGKKPILVVEDQ